MNSIQILTRYDSYFSKLNITRSLNTIEKRVAAVAVVALGSLLALYLAIRLCRYFKAKETNPKTEVEVQKEVEIEGKPEPKSTESTEGKLEKIELSKEKPTKVEEKLEIESELKSTESTDSTESKPEEVEVKIEKSKNQQEQLVTLEDHRVIEQEKPVISDEPALLSFGKVRTGTGVGAPPDLIGLMCKNFIVGDFEKELTAVFACCFHTTESQEEIMKLIQDIRVANDPVAHLFKPTPNYEQSLYMESKNRLYNNLIYLHEALPGEKQAKEAKIYWSERVEKTLLPYLLMNENVNIDRLVFATVSGEIVSSPFQALHMDFTTQLQFIGIKDEKALNDVNDVTEEKKLMGKLLVKVRVEPQKTEI